MRVAMQNAESPGMSVHAGSLPHTLYDTGPKKRRVVGLVLLAVLLSLFLAFNRLPKLDTVEADLAAAASPKAECFQGFCFESDPDTSLLSRWWDFSLAYLRLVTVGMTFAFLVAGATEVFLFPDSRFQGFASRGVKGSLKGLLVGPAMNLCSACIVPVASAFRRRGAGIEATIAITQGSSTLNLPAMIMAAMVFSPLIGGSRIALSIVGAILIGPVVARLALGRGQPLLPESEAHYAHDEEGSTWGEVLRESLPQWVWASLRYLLRLGPIMVVAGFASGLAIQWISPDTVTAWLGDDLLGIGIAATLGILINVPLLFEIPLVAALLLAGMGTAPAATLLFAAAAGGPITFWGLAKVMPRKAIVSFGAAIWVVGVIGGMSVLGITTVTEGRDFGLRASYASPPQTEDSQSQWLYDSFIGTDWLFPLKPVPQQAITDSRRAAAANLYEGDYHWITLRLRGRMAIDGTGSDADGVGARVSLTATSPGGASATQVAEVRESMSGSGLDFGLGKAERVDSITVLWPSGVRQVLQDLESDQVITIEEPERQYHQPGKDRLAVSQP